MQFKGSVRAPGDKDPGVRVVLEIDEYHLEFRRDSELIGRYYLADVEVARDIGERFILFLGDDEVEFLADDALQFAYGGVTAMQDAWLAAQKKKRRHRRAAEAAARKKDEEPIRELETVSRPVHVSDSDTLRSRRLQAGSKPPQTASGRLTPGLRPAAPVDKPMERPVEKPAQTATEKPADTPIHNRKARKQSPPEHVAPAAESAAAPFETEKETTGPPVRAKATATPKGPRKSTAAAGRQPRAANTSRGPRPADPDESTPMATQGTAAPNAYTPAQDSAATAAHRQEAAPEPPEEDDTSLAALRKKITEARARDGEDLGRVRVPQPASARQLAPESAEPDLETAGGRVTNGVDGAEGQVRYAQAGHHPFETSTGLLSKLRRQPKRPVNHVHSFKESGSSVGLVRRVCIECSFVSIGSDDD